MVKVRSPANQRALDILLLTSRCIILRGRFCKPFATMRPQRATKSKKCVFKSTPIYRLLRMELTLLLKMSYLPKALPNQGPNQQPGKSPRAASQRDGIVSRYCGGLGRHLVKTHLLTNQQQYFSSGTYIVATECYKFSAEPAAPFEAPCSLQLSQTLQFIRRFGVLIDA